MSNKKGFTLIELLVVIAIIALLLSIMMPALNKAKDRAKTVVCLSNMHQWSLVTRLYVDDNDDKFVTPVGVGDYWMSRLREYYNNPEIRVCPSARGFQYNKNGTVDPAAISSVTNYGPFDNSLTPWAMDGDYGSYGVNFYTYSPSGVNQWKNLYVKGGSSIPLIIDAWWPEGMPTESEPPPNNEEFMWDDPEVFSNNMARFCSNRHNGYVGGLFMDLSGRKVGLKELWTLRWSPNFDRQGDWTAAGGMTPGAWPEWMRGFKDY